MGEHQPEEGRHFTMGNLFPLFGPNIFVLIQYLISLASLRI